MIRNSDLAVVNLGCLKFICVEMYWRLGNAVFSSGERLWLEVQISQCGRVALDIS